jgi:hypothetical protein
MNLNSAKAQFAFNFLLLLLFDRRVDYARSGKVAGSSRDKVTGFFN